MAASESMRLAYLDAMGVDVWVPRLVLPGARPAPLRAARVAPVKKSADSAAAEAAPAVQQESGRGAGEAATTALRELVAQGEGRPAPATAPEPATTATDSLSLVFEVHIAAGVGVLVSDAASGQAAAATRLATNILSALIGTSANIAPRRSVIQWPPVAAREQNNDREAAREFACASVSAAIQQAKRPRLLVLGEQAGLLLGGEGGSDGPLRDVAIVRGPALQTMLTNPETKASLWRAMQTLLD